MTRVSPRLLFLLGALLLALWVAASPLSSSPPARLSPTTVPDVAPQAALDEMNREVDRLEARLSRPVRPAAPDRDPFQFAPAAGAYLMAPGAPVASDAGVQPRAAAPVAWPTLVAILTTGSDQAPERRVVLEDAAGVVRILGIGERVGDVTVSAIRDGVVTLTHVAAEQSTTLTLQ